MAITFTKHKTIELKKHPDFSEAWLHDRICEDPAMLGLGDLEILGRERTQFTGGRLDILMGDGDNTRYEVEILLGATDPSHIIRCIEYWDVERRRYPAYEHVAVLVAEQVTSRFLNVMSLLAGSIPLVAIQINALQVGENIVVDFVKVLDQRALRVDDEGDQGGENVDRNTWVAKTGDSSLKVCDELLEMANENRDTKFELNYLKRHITLTSIGAFLNVLVFFPRKSFVRVQSRPQYATDWRDRLEDAGLSASLVHGGTRIRFNLQPGEIDKHRDLLREFVLDAVEQHQS